MKTSNEKNYSMKSCVQSGIVLNKKMYVKVKWYNGKYKCKKI